MGHEPLLPNNMLSDGFTGGRHKQSDSNSDSELLIWVTEIWTGKGAAPPPSVREQGSSL